MNLLWTLFCILYPLGMIITVIIKDALGSNLSAREAVLWPIVWIRDYAHGQNN